MQSGLKKILKVLFSAAVMMACIFVLMLYPARLVRRTLSRRVLSLWTGTPVLTMPIKCQAERLLGIDARSLAFSTYHITDAFDYNLSRFTAIPIVGRLVPLAVFVWACLVVDRLHFYCDRGILPSRRPFTFDFRELYIYRLFGIDVFLWSYGADVRNQTTARAMGTPNTCMDCDSPGRYCLCDEQLAAENMQKLSSLSVAIFAGVGDMFGYTPGSVDDLFYWPIDLEADSGGKYRPAYPEVGADGLLRVVHAPNHQMFKGTRFLVQAVETLQKEGEQVELVLVERMSNIDALQLYRSADVIFDQCLMGSLGYFALEAMALGKPVMCFVRDPDRYLLHPQECPFINTHVDTLKEDLRRVIHGRDSLAEIGKQGRSYVERHFSVPAFAERLSNTYLEFGIEVSESRWRRDPATRNLG